jgi:uracil-DNA glycosylase family 4
VPPWGTAKARLLIVGLAPGMHGANRTGAPFTGDASGTFLFRALHRAGFASAADANHARLQGARITNAVKCLPPDNRPIAAEISNCASYLASELEALTGKRPGRNRVVLCLGKLAHDAVSRALNDRLPAFRHGQLTPTSHTRLWAVDTYHPSRLNTNTGRLSESMLDEILLQISDLLDD